MHSDDLRILTSRFNIAALKSVAYEHLSGWKQSGAFRVFLTSPSGMRTLIYKNSVYDEKEIPALEGLSVFPGPPEYVIYGRADHALGRYLPGVYLLRCAEAGRHYQYLLQDLDQDHAGLSGPGAILSVCGELPRLYRDMASSLAPSDQEQLLRFDKAFCEDLLKYAEASLRRFAAERVADSVREVMAQWDDLSAVYARNLRDIYGRSTLHPIHGDLNLTNIRMLNDESGNLKFIDWEWAGIGGWWFDLVALLKTAPEDLEQNGLKRFLRASETQYTEREMRTYRWAKMQRGLFDASFFAKQILNSANKAPTRIILENHMEKAIDRAMESFRWLQHHN